MLGFMLGFCNPKLVECFVVDENICWVTQKTLTQPTLFVAEESDKKIDVEVAHIAQMGSSATE
jgi:hypothetical protein